MGEPDVVVIRVSKGKGSQKLRKQWSKKYPQLKSCYVSLEKLQLSEGSIKCTYKDLTPVNKHERRPSNKSPSVTSEDDQSSPKPEELPKKSSKSMNLFEDKPGDSISKKPKKEKEEEHKETDGEEPIMLNIEPKKSRKIIIPSKEKVETPPETIFDASMTTFSKQYADMASIIYRNCFQMYAYPGYEKPTSIYVHLIDNHRKNCQKCDSMICAKYTRIPALFDPYYDKTFQLMEVEKQLRETRMILKMSEEARAIMDNLYEEKLNTNLHEINELKRMIHVLIQEEVPKDTPEIMQHNTQPILETKERRYYTSCGYNMMNMTALREALNKAQKCGHGNLIILEHEDERDHLAARLVLLCQTCKNETLFYTSGFASKIPGYFTINKAILNTLGQNSFFKLVDFVKHKPFSRQAKFVGPFLSEKDGTKDKVKLILGIDKFEFDDWTKLGLSKKRPSIDSREDEIEVTEKGDNQGKRIKIKNLEPEVNLRNEDYGSLNNSSKNNLSLVDELKLEYLKNNPDKPKILFPELPKRPKIIPKPISQLMASPQKQSVTTHSDLTPIVNANNNANNSNVSNLNGSTKGTNSIEKASSPSTQNKSLSSLPPILKIKPSKDLPPGSRILSIAPGTKLMSTNVCHSTKQDTGLNHGVYRVIDDKNKEKILIIKDLQQPGSPPVANIVNLKAVKASKSNSIVSTVVSKGNLLPTEDKSIRTVTSLPSGQIIRKGHTSMPYKLNSTFYTQKVTKVEVKTQIINTNGVNSSAPIKSTTKVVDSSHPIMSNGMSSIYETDQLVVSPTATLIPTTTTSPPSSLLKNQRSNIVNDIQFTKTNSNKRKNPSNNNSALKETQATLLSLKSNWYESPVQETDPLADPLESDDIIMDPELSNEDNIEMKSSKNPLVKLVSILPDNIEEDDTGDDKLIPLPKCDIIESEREYILESASKRTKIDC